MYACAGLQELYSGIMGTGLRQRYRCTGEVQVFRGTSVVKGYCGTGIVQLNGTGVIQ